MLFCCKVTTKNPFDQEKAPLIPYYGPKFSLAYIRITSDTPVMVIQELYFLECDRIA